MNFENPPKMMDKNDGKGAKPAEEIEPFVPNEKLQEFSARAGYAKAKIEETATRRENVETLKKEEDKAMRRTIVLGTAAAGSTLMGPAAPPVVAGFFGASLVAAHETYGKFKARTHEKASADQSEGEAQKAYTENREIVTGELRARGASIEVESKGLNVPKDLQEIARKEMERNMTEQARKKYEK